MSAERDGYTCVKCLDKCEDCTSEERAGFLALAMLDKVLASSLQQRTPVRLEVVAASDGDQTVSLTVGES